MQRKKKLWKPIERYEDEYIISDRGDIFSLTEAKLMKQPLFQGYKTVRLSRQGIRESFFSHRLVAQHFIPNPDNKPIVNHKKGNRADNRAWMLEWVTALENSHHARHVLGRKMGGSQKRDRLHRPKFFVPVNQYDIEGNLLNTYESIHEAAKAIAVIPGNIQLCILGRREQCKGYIWRAAIR